MGGSVLPQGKGKSSKVYRQDNKTYRMKSIDQADKMYFAAKSQKMFFIVI
jgi:hypothetical protein